MMTSQGQNGKRVGQQPGVNNPRGSSSTGGYQPPNTTCPLGLEYLIPLDKVFLHQRVDPFEGLTGIHASNRYTVVDTRGQPLYVIRENSNSFTRLVFGASRSFKMPIYDKNGRVILLIKRPLQWLADTMEVYCHGDILLGTIEKTIMSFAPHYRIYDRAGVKKLEISGPLIRGFNPKFKVMAPNGGNFGTIQKKWSGLGRELFTNADIFGVSFHRDLDVKVKAMLLAAAILIDFDHFEG